MSLFFDYDLAGESIGEDLGDQVDNFINPLVAFFASLFKIV